MFDKELTLEVLKQIDTAVQRILTRFKPIHEVSDFTDSLRGYGKDGFHMHDADCDRRIIEKPGQDNGRIPA